MNNKDTKDIDTLSELLDSRFEGPFGMRFGLDGLIGLIPGVGDTISSVIGSYLLIRAAQLKVSPTIIALMGINLLFDQFLGTIPLFGDVFDFVWKANDKNAKLIQKHRDNPKIAKRSAFFALTLAATFAILSILCSIYFLIAIVSFIASL